VIINDTGFLQLPKGTTLQRPSSPQNGYMRFNTDENNVEAYIDGEWVVALDLSGLYNFTTATFTNGGQTGRLGPSLTQARDGLTGPETSNWKNNTSFFDISNGIQLWTVPSSGTYRIEAWGAQGGGNNGGLGARMRGDFSLTEGQVLRILVGQRGTNGNSSDQNSQGGGGGTFVVASPYDTLASAMVVAGGGGGSQGTYSGNRNAPTTQAGLAGAGVNGGAGGGSNGTGGGSTVRSSGGGGFTGNGASPGGSTGGASFVNGGVGGDGSPGGFGGFGGGGGTRQTGWRGSGGGGGYSGGGSGYQRSNTTNHSGGGGGSINNGTNQSNSSGVRTGHGQVVITKL